MSTWEPMPDTVWDKDGDRWDYVEERERWMKEDGTRTTTLNLLSSRGPVTDVKPIKVGDEVTPAELVDLPEGSIAARANSWPWITGTEGRFWQAGDGAVYSVAEVKKMHGGPFTVLRVGWGETK